MDGCYIQAKGRKFRLLEWIGGLEEAIELGKFILARLPEFLFLDCHFSRTTL